MRTFFRPRELRGPGNVFTEELEEEIPPLRQPGSYSPVGSNEEWYSESRRVPNEGERPDNLYAHADAPSSPLGFRVDSSDSKTDEHESPQEIDQAFTLGDDPGPDGGVPPNLFQNQEVSSDENSPRSPSPREDEQAAILGSSHANSSGTSQEDNVLQ